VRYPELKTIRFSAGLELTLPHIGFWLLTWLVRLKVIRSLEPYAAFLLKFSRIFDLVGSDRSAFHMKLFGTRNTKKSITVLFELVANSGHGPYIPCMPAILLTKKLTSNNMNRSGATPCVGLISLNEYLEALKDYKIEWQVETI
jgi:hypothetical protein